tara:strand:- start:182 stop:298 length:117 start_codon:yes stop_codon:yes gene_type:complete
MHVIDMGGNAEEEEEVVHGTEEEKIFYSVKKYSDWENK